MKIQEFPRLLMINLIVSLKGFFEYCKVVWFYYRSSNFRKADLALLAAYFGCSPFRVHKQYMKQLGKENIYLYGETYLTTMDTLAAKAAISPKDTYVELGCGRGRTCFWVRCFKECKTIGIDYVPAFIEKAQAIACRQNLDQIEFYYQDFLIEKWPLGTIYCLDGTLLEGEEIASIIRTSDLLPEGTRFIAINFSFVGDFPDQRPQWQLKEAFTVSYPWGEADAAIFIKSRYT